MQVADHVKNLHEHRQSQIHKLATCLCFSLKSSPIGWWYYVYGWPHMSWAADFFFWHYFFIPFLLRVNIRFIIFHIKLEYPWITINASHIEVSRCLALNELGMKKRSGNFEHWIVATFELIKVTILWWIHYLLEVIHKNKNGQFSSNHKNPKCVLDF